MTKTIWYALFLFLLSACGKKEAHQQTQQTQEVQEIHHLANEFTQAWNRHDAKGIADVWADDGDLITPWAKAIEGKTEIEKHFASEQADMMKDSNVVLEIKNVRMITPDVAFVDADFTISGMTIAGEKADPLHNYGVFLLVKRDGKWKILIARPY